MRTKTEQQDLLPGIDDEHDFNLTEATRQDYAFEVNCVICNNSRTIPARGLHRSLRIRHSPAYDPDIRTLKFRCRCGHQAIYKPVKHWR